MIGLEDRLACEALIYREARLIDAQDWDRWLALYDEQAEFWIPAWDGEHVLTEDPQAEISLMYYSDRTGLEDRVYRLRTGLSSASTPLPRTNHAVSALELDAVGDRQIRVRSSFFTLSYRFHEAHTFAGRYEHRLARDAAGEWRILGKKVVVINDRIPSLLDFYSV